MTKSGTTQTAVVDVRVGMTGMTDIPYAQANTYMASTRVNFRAAAAHRIRMFQGRESKERGGYVTVCQVITFRCMYVAAI